MNIALDYDGTYTSDPNLWLRFILDCQAAGHSVWIVTMRYPSECEGDAFDSRLKGLFVPVIATSRTAKKPFCDALKVPIHIWIDDHPEAVHADAMSIWKESAPEGSPVVPTYE